MLSITPCESVMPPEHYKNMAEQSKVKAIALVESVKIIDTTRHATTKEVKFKLRHSFVGRMPDAFSGTCYSVHAFQEPMAGGTIYFYPEPGDLVYVTIAGVGGMITSYTYLNDIMETLFIDNADKIRYGMGNAWLEL